MRPLIALLGGLTALVAAATAHAQADSDGAPVAPGAGEPAPTVATGSSPQPMAAPKSAAPAASASAAPESSAAPGSAPNASANASASASAATAAAPENTDLAAEYEKLDPETKQRLEDAERERITDAYADKFTGFQHALRLGIEIPFGDVPQRNFVLDVDSLNDYVEWRMPIWVDVGYRLDPNWWIGGYMQVGLGGAGSGCPGDVDCFWTDFRLGLEGRYHMVPSSRWDPSVGLGLGYGWLETQITVQLPTGDELVPFVAARYKRNLGALQLNLDVGADYELGHSVTLGPFFVLNGGMFLSDSIACPSNSPLPCPEGSSVSAPAFHGSVALLARGRFGP